MRKLMQVGLVFCFVGSVLFMIQLNRVDRAPVTQSKVVECDFYSVDAIYYFPGSAEEAKRKSCEKKYYGYAESDKVKIFNLGGVDFEIAGNFGFVLNTDEILIDPQRYRGSADLYLYKPILGMDGVIDAGRIGNGPNERGIMLKLMYRVGGGENKSKLLGADGLGWDSVSTDKRTGGIKYFNMKNTSWGGVKYVIKMKDGYNLHLSCNHDVNSAEPIDCLASRMIMPNYSIGYKISWYVVQDWVKFDEAIKRFVLGMMRV